MSGGTAIELREVVKRYRRHSDRSTATTLKSLLVRDLWRRRDDATSFVHALQGVSATIRQGSTVGVIGRNGSGKSTMLKLITQILKPDAGEIVVNGRVAALIELGAGFHPELTGRENVFINGIILGLTKAEIRKRMDAIVAFAELEEFIDDPVRTYSSGMYMRLGFAVAINVDPEILVMDEVFAVGDVAFMRKCVDRMDEFKRAGKTIVLVTHDAPMVASWCDEAIWLDQGKIAQAGQAAPIVEAYLATVLEEPLFAPAVAESP